MTGPRWTPAEDAIIREHYRDGVARVVELTGRSPRAVWERAHRLGVNRRPQWSAREDAVLVNNWGYMPMLEIARLVGRTQVAIYRRARSLGIGGGCPNGFEYLSAAAVRTGFPLKSLRRVLAWHGVLLRRAGAHSFEGTRYPRHFVEPADVDDAVRAWCATETVPCAAERYGVSAKTMKKWLDHARAMGVAMPAPKAGKCWRVPTATIDAVVAARMPRKCAGGVKRRAA